MYKRVSELSLSAVLRQRHRHRRVGPVYGPWSPTEVAVFLAIAIEAMVSSRMLIVDGGRWPRSSRFICTFADVGLVAALTELRMKYAS